MSAVNIEILPDEGIKTIGRVYYSGSYENADPIDAVFNAIVYANGVVHIKAAKGELSLDAQKEAIKQLLLKFPHLTHVKAERRRGDGMKETTVPISRILGH